MFGLAFCNQQASALVLAPLAVFVIWILKEAALTSWRSLAQWGALGLTLGLSPYLLLSVAALRPQQGSWGDLSSLGGILRHVLRQEYGTLRLGIPTPDAESALERIRAYLWDSAVQTTWSGPLLGLIGIVWTLTARRRAGAGPSSSQAAAAAAAAAGIRKFGLGLMASWAFHVVVWHTVFSNISLKQAMGRAVHARFWIQPNLLLCVASGAGVRCLMDGFSDRIWRSPLRYCIRYRSIIDSMASASVPIMLALLLVTRRWHALNRGAWSGRSDGWTMHLYAQVKNNLFYCLPGARVESA